MTESTPMEALDVFAGKWRTEGRIFGEGDQVETRLKATDFYEWFPGRHFLLHHVDGHMGDDEVRALEVIGYDPGADAIVSRSYDNGGATSEYHVRLDGRDWSIDGATERFRGGFDDGFGVLQGDWELLQDGKWRRWMTIRLVKS